MGQITYSGKEFGNRISSKSNKELNNMQRFGDPYQQKREGEHEKARH
jgi:hypothetical protein